MPRRRSPHAHVAAVLAALALLLAGLVPSGWMPRAGAHGVDIVICTASGAVAAVVDLGTGGSGEEEHGADRSACAFAGLSQAAPAPASADLLQPARPGAEAAPATGPPAPPAAAPAVRLPPAQGPPFSA
ncbi:MAG: DUF2946 family protein [Thermaurantiacus sp.]